MTSTRDSKALFTTSLTPLHFEHSQAMENLGSSPRKRVPGFLRRCLNSKCPSSGQVSALVFTPDTTFPFLLEMRCDHCNAKVHMCSTCSNTKTQHLSKGQILRHCHDHHHQWLQDSTAVKSRAKRKTMSGHVSTVGPARSRSVGPAAALAIAAAPMPPHLF
jgi:hypothetical protein